MSPRKKNYTLPNLLQMAFNQVGTYLEDPNLKLDDRIKLYRCLSYFKGTSNPYPVNGKGKVKDQTLEPEPEGPSDGDRLISRVMG